jgi:flagellin
MLGITQGTLTNSTEKLSSGYKINRAADDAAGLAISEKMRKQIRGLTQASLNAEDGISAVQTAEGALTEVHDMLQRMNELAVKAANGTNSEDDRSFIQDEIDQLSQEIDRVAETTKFNETYLLKGDTTNPNKQYTYSYNVGQKTKAAEVEMGTNQATGASVASISFSTSATTTDQNTLAKAFMTQGITITSTTINGAQQIYITLNGSDAKANYQVQSTSVATDFNVVNSDGVVVATIKGADIGANMSASITASSASAAESTNEVFSYYDKDGNAIAANDLNNYFTANGGAVGSATATARADSPKVYDALGKEVTLDNKYVSANYELTSTLKIKFHVGADGTSNNQISVNIEALSAKGLGITGIRVDGSDGTNATGALTVLSAAIKKVSTQRSTLGAVQNRLEHTINNLDNIVENTTAAESQIRDTDMATEMVRYSNANILAQAGQSMLAQSNQMNQGVLNLLS